MNVLADKRAPAYGTPCLDAVVLHEIQLKEILQGFFVAFLLCQATADKEWQVPVFRLHGFRFSVIFQCRCKVPQLAVAGGEVADSKDCCSTLFK